MNRCIGDRKRVRVFYVKKIHDKYGLQSKSTFIYMCVVAITYIVADWMSVVAKRVCVCVLPAHTLYVRFVRPKSERFLLRTHMHT